MSLIRLSILGLGLGLALHASPAMADIAEWDTSDDGDDEDGGEEGEDEGGEESGDEGGEESGDAEAAESEDEGGCATAAINPTTLLSVGLGIGLLFGLRRRTDGIDSSRNQHHQTPSPIMM